MTCWRIMLSIAKAREAVVTEAEMVTGPEIVMKTETETGAEAMVKTEAKARLVESHRAHSG